MNFANQLRFDRVSSASTSAPVSSPPTSCQTVLATSDSQPTSATTSCTSDLTDKSSAFSLRTLSVTAPLFAPSSSSYSLNSLTGKLVITNFPVKFFWDAVYSVKCD